MSFNKEFYDIVQKGLCDFQQEYKIEIMVASLGGSLSIGTNNIFSDLDIYAIYDDDKKTLPYKIKFQSKFLESNLHVISCGKNEILDNLDSYDMEYSSRRYPTYSHRTEKEIETNHNLTMYEREDYPRTLVYYTLLGNMVWLFEYSLEDLFNLFEKGLKIVDALDFYYTKAVGNYEHFVREKNQISARKYITIIQEILYCRYMIEERTIPPMNLKELVDIYHNNFSQKELIDFERAFSMNQNSKESKEKTLLTVPNSLIIYTSKWLKCLSEKFGDVDKYYFDIKDMRRYFYENN